MNNQLANKKQNLRISYSNYKPPYRNRFLINKGNSYIIFPVAKVAYFYVSDDILYAVAFNRKEYHIDSNMKTLEEELDPSVFYRVNRQFIINVNSVDSLEPYFNGKLLIKTIPESKEKMIVSRLKAKGFKSWVGY